MKDDPRSRRTISIDLLGGTAKPVYFPSIIPVDKRQKEVFWVSQWFSVLPEYAYRRVSIEPNDDDSHGKHDVLCSLDCYQQFGVQVTELTSELKRYRTALAERHTQRILEELEAIKARSDSPIAVQVNIDDIESRKPRVPKPAEIAKAIAGSICEGVTGQHFVKQCEYFSLTFTPIERGQLYLESRNQIGVQAVYDALPRSIQMYENAIDYLVRKKANSQSPWLVVWSTSFGGEGDWLQIEVLEYMKFAFSDSQFERVYFIESMDGEALFQANLHWHQIK